MSDAVRTPFDVVTMGRLGVDLYPLQDRVGLAEARTFSKSLGGSAANVAVAVARHGRRAALVSRVGDDPFGRYLSEELVRLGVSSEGIRVDPVLKTPLTFCEIFPPDDFPLYFYREPKAPDVNIESAEVDLAAVRAAGVFWVTTTGLSAEPSRTAHHAALDARGRRGFTVIDLDYRPVFWGTARDARAQIDRVLPDVTVAVGNLDECEVAVGERDADRAADALLERGLELAVIKRGGDGVLAKTATERVEVPALRVTVLNGLGAGDAFGGGLCHGLLSGWSLRETIEFANAAGAIVASRRECSTAMPTPEEIARLRAGEVVA